MKKNNNILFLIAIILMLSLGGMTFLKEPETISELENRPLNQFEGFTLRKFLDGTFQDNLESAMSDQMVGSEKIREVYTQSIQHLTTIDLENRICKGRYLKIQSDESFARGRYDCDDRIIYLPRYLSEDDKAVINDNIKKYNHINSIVDTYYYVIEDALTFDFVSGKKVFDYYGLLKEELISEKGLSHLKYSNYDGYKDYFYKTDHHWNSEGAYLGLISILKMLDIKEQPLKSEEYFSNHEDFFGSHARAVSNYDYPEEFKYYKYPLREHDVLINGVPGSYNHYDEYEKHNYIYNRVTNYYAYVFGSDYGEVIFDYKRPLEPNLLILSNSYGNAIKEIVAQYFNKTFTVDLRHYKEQMGKDFVLSEYLKEHKISKVLLIVSPSFIYSLEPNRGLEF